MKNIIFLISISFFISCKKEKEPPIELIGKWKMHFKEHKIIDGGGIYIWTDTITSNNKTFEFLNNWIVKTNKYYPNCMGNYWLTDNNKHLYISFDCNNALPDYIIFKNTIDTLVLQKDDGIDMYNEIYLKD
jgi:hypothetical protein